MNNTYNISDAKTNFSKLAQKVKKGETIILSERNIPFAQISPISTSQENISQLRKNFIGSLKDKIVIHDSFYDPMSEEELKEWYGE